MLGFEGDPSYARGKRGTRRSKCYSGVVVGQQGWSNEVMKQGWSNGTII